MLTSCEINCVGYVNGIALIAGGKYGEALYDMMQKRLRIRKKLYFSTNVNISLIIFSRDGLRLIYSLSSLQELFNINKR